MLVHQNNFAEVLYEISQSKRIALDTETTGLRPYKGDRVFSIIIHTDADNGYYFNFNKTADHLGDLPDFLLKEDAEDLISLLPQFERVYIHNAKFDMHQLCESFRAIQYVIRANIYCTEALSRLVRNDLMSYSLDNLGKLIGHEKDDRVKQYISEHKLFTLEDTGKKSPDKKPHYDKVPLEIMYEYGLQDAKVCYELGEYVINRLEQYDYEQIEQGFKSNKELINTELELTKVLFKMERRGVKINEAYCSSAFEYYRAQITIAKEEFYQLTGLEFSDSRKVLAPAFEKLGLEYPTTDKGNASFTDKVLSEIDNPIANIIKNYRAAYKSAYTYYKNFLDLSDANYVLHTNLRQGGTTTGRLSCREPNLQNVPKRKDTGEYKARGAFIPREDYFFCMIDFDQMEYRLFMDYAEEMDLINKVLDGLDVHTATAEMVEVKRDIAKTINFLLLYGGGPSKLAGELGIELYQAKAYRSKYFENLQNVKAITSAIIRTAESRGYILNTMGRRCYIPKQLAYKAPNYLIQGGCGDIVKKAMIELDRFLTDKKSKMLLQIHDEILYEIHYSEYHIIDELKNIMVNAYKHTHLPLTAGADFSFTSWYDKKGLDYGEITSNIKYYSNAEGLK